MSFNYPANASLVGPGLQSALVGVHNLDYNRINFLDLSVPVIPTTNLYCHYDFSRLSDSVNSTYTANNTQISSGGTSIGAVSTTPAISYYVSGGTYPVTVISQGTNALKGLRFAGSTALNTGCYLESGVPSHPDVTSSGYTWFEVIRFTNTIVNWTRSTVWMLDAYSNDYNHATWWQNTTTTELDLMNYQGAQIYYIDNTLPKNGVGGVLYVALATLYNDAGSARVRRTLVRTGATTPASTTGSSVSSTPAYATTATSARKFRAHTINYNGTPYSYPEMDLFECGFYTSPMSQADMESTATALWNKWS